MLRRPGGSQGQKPHSRKDPLCLLQFPGVGSYVTHTGPRGTGQAKATHPALPGCSFMKKEAPISCISPPTKTTLDDRQTHVSIRAGLMLDGKRQNHE